MDTERIFPLLLTLAIAAMAAYQMIRRRRTARIMQTQLLIGEAMMRRGITPAHAEAAGRGNEVFGAARQCAVCAVDGECREQLSAVPKGDLPGECPNRGIFDEIAAHKASIQVPDSKLLDSQPLV